MDQSIVKSSTLLTDIVDDHTPRRKNDNNWMTNISDRINHMSLELVHSTLSLGHSQLETLMGLGITQNLTSRDPRRFSNYWKNNM